jgi:hypothetical protein
MWNLHAILRRLGIEDHFNDIDGLSGEQPAFETDISATVFGGEPRQWLRYLGTKRAERHAGAPVRILWNPAEHALEFRAEDSATGELAEVLNRGLTFMRQQLQRVPHAACVLDDMIFGNASNGAAPLTLRVNPELPTEATREVDWDNDLRATDACIVVQQSLVESVLRELRGLGPDATAETRLGLTWPLLRQVVSYLGYPSYPRDRFIEKINVTVRDMLLALNLLFQEGPADRLVANAVGAAYLRYESRQAGIAEDDLFSQHPYFRLLSELSYLLRANWSTHETLAKIQIREFLDACYLRLSVASIMPGPTPAMAPMKFRYRKKWVSTPLPRLQRYGIVDQDDLAAWKKVEAPFRDLGFILLRQLGIGQFGRVYEALNTHNASWPERVAVKVDRLGEQQNVIQDTVTTLQTSRDLAASPHVIRIFDAGRLRWQQLTYHVLQLVDGEAVDHLTHLTGREHASVPRPAASRHSFASAEQEYLQSVRSSGQEAWRRERMRAPFTRPLSVNQVLDLITSVLLWVEEVHKLNYAVNDLKAGNVMISRHGQLKGIDMDSYSPVSNRFDLLTDFFFLAISLWMFLRFVQGRSTPGVEDQQLRSPDSIRAALSEAWNFGDVSQVSHGRVGNEDVLNLLGDLISRSRTAVYAKDGELFAADIDRLIRLKRRVSMEEIVLD